MKLFRNGCSIKWRKFGPLLGLSYEGFEDDIKELFKAIELRRTNIVEEGSKSVGGKCLLKELRSLRVVNYMHKMGDSSVGIDRRGKGIKLK